jgi:hypothetical protein
MSLFYLTATVASGASASNVLSFGDRFEPVFVVTPSALEATTDEIGFKVWFGLSAATFVDLYTSGGTLRTVTCTSASARGIEIPDAVRKSLRAADRFKIVTYDGGVAQAQDAARTFYVRAMKAY